MTLENRESIEYASEQLNFFFPTLAMDIDTEELRQKILEKTILLDPQHILPYLQSALYDEKIVEMHLDNSRDVYFSTLRDYPPSDEPEEISGNIENSDEDLDEDKDAYRYGDYLKSCKNIVSLPVEPGIGNVNLRRSSRVMLRLYTTSTTIELGACFHSLVEVEGIPLLNLSFPTIARVIQEDREFRARVPKTFNLRLHVARSRKWKKFDAKLKDISPKGLGFIVPRELVKAFAVECIVKGTLVLTQDGKSSKVDILGEVKHTTRMRIDKSIEYTCGIFLHFHNPTDASKVERLVAQTQRAHMREITAKSDAYGVDLMM